MAKSHTSQRYRRDRAKYPYRDRERPQNLVFSLITSILLHSVLFLGSDYWLRAFAPKQESKPIPIEYVEVPPDETKTPPETSRRAAKDSVAGGEAKPQRPISMPQSASAAPKASTVPELSVVPPEQTSQKAVSPNPSPQKLQSKPSLTAVAPTKPAEPEPSPPAVTPTKPLALKLRQRVITPTKPTEPEPSPPAVTPTKPLALKLRQRVVTPTKPTQPEASPPAVTPTTKPLALKLRQRVVTPTKLPEPEPSATAIAPTKPLALKPTPPAVTPTKPLALKPTLPAVTPTKPLALKPKQTTVAPTLTPPTSSRRDSGRVAAKSSPEQLENRTSLRKPSQIQPNTSRKPSSKSGGASSLGGPINLSSRDLGNNLAALPNSNFPNRSTQGIDARQDPDLGSYMKQLQERVRQQWIPGVTQSSRRTVLYFTVTRSGQVSNLQIAQTSGYSFTDEAAVGAVKRAVPFAPLPTAYTEDYINIHFTFNINVYGELELQRSYP